MIYMIFIEILTYPADHNPARIRKADQLFGDELDIEDTKFRAEIKDVHKIDIKNYDSHLIMQKLGKFNSKTSVIPNGLAKI